MTTKSTTGTVQHIRNGVCKKKARSKLDLLVDYLKCVKDENFTGYIKINYTQGQIGRVERFEEILKK